MVNQNMRLLIRFGGLALVLAAVFSGMPAVWSLVLGGIGLVGFIWAGGGT